MDSRAPISIFLPIVLLLLFGCVGNAPTALPSINATDQPQASNQVGTAAAINPSINATGNNAPLNAASGDCKLLLKANSEPSYNFFFLPPVNSTQGDFTSQENTVSAIIGDFLRIDPYSSYKGSFNFYFIEKEPAYDCEVGADPSQCDNDRLVGIVMGACGLPEGQIHQVIALSRGNGAGAGIRGQQPGYSMVRFGMNETGITLAHEVAHGFDFGDEYHAGDVRGPAQLNAPNVGGEGCPKWCSGALNRSNPYYQFYEGWKQCVLSKNLTLNPTRMSVTTIAESEIESEAWNSCWDEWAEKYYDAANSGEFVKECPYVSHNRNIGNGSGVSPITVSISSVPLKPRNCEDANVFDNLNLGTGCTGNTGCYFTAFGVNQWRQLPNSIMRTETGWNASQINDAKFGDYSEKILSGMIANFTTGSN